MWEPSADGKDHVNIYSQGATELGRFLSNFTRCTLTTLDGTFQSIEGYWYWLLTDLKEREILRTMFGPIAKSIGRKLENRGGLSTSSPEFRGRVRHAIDQKLLGSPEHATKLSSLRLPLAHYYVFGGKAHVPFGDSWVVEHMESKKLSASTSG